MSEITLLTDTIDTSLIELLSLRYLVIIEGDNERIVMKLHTLNQEGLARARANGVKLGRKKGGKNAKYKLSDKEDRLIEMLCIEHRSKEYIAKKLRCSVSCLNAHIKRMKEKKCPLPTHE